METKYELNIITAHSNNIKTKETATSESPFGLVYSLISKITPFEILKEMNHMLHDESYDLTNLVIGQYEECEGGNFLTKQTFKGRNSVGDRSVNGINYILDTFINADFIKENSIKNTTIKEGEKYKITLYKSNDRNLPAVILLE